MGALGLLWLALWVMATRRGGPCRQAVEKGPHYSLRGQAVYCALFLAVGVGVPAAVILYGPRLIAPLRARFADVCAASPWLRPGPVLGVVSGCGGHGALLAHSLALAGRRFWNAADRSRDGQSCWYFVNDWLMKYLREYRQLDVKTAAFIATLVFLLPIWEMS